MDLATLLAHPAASGDIRQMAVAYERISHVGRWAQAEVVRESQ